MDNKNNKYELTKSMHRYLMALITNIIGDAIAEYGVVEKEVSIEEIGGAVWLDYRGLKYIVYNISGIVYGATNLNLAIVDITLSVQKTFKHILEEGNNYEDTNS